MLEYCRLCHEPTGRAGRGEDSIYLDCLRPLPWINPGDEIGPLCPECAHKLIEEGKAE